MSWNCVAALSKLAGVSNSTTWPPSNTSTLSQSMMVSRRCAMVRVVQPPNCSFSVRCTSASVMGSTLAVASSRIRKDVHRSNARARQKSCRCPTLKFSPPASTTSCRPRGSLETTAFRPHRSSAVQIRSSSWSPNMSRHCRTVPANRVGSCGMMVMLDRSVCSGSSATSTPPTSTWPPQHGTSRKRAEMRLLLPAPVLPTTPTFSPGWMRKLQPQRAAGRPAP
mmetsp:Transcript_21951/g.39492  ORF Transcript_21951/g.39492 Transcript_21951/m.39492 type:complete len:223 (+) Transcript_21951:17-685(+)